MSLNDFPMDSCFVTITCWDSNFRPYWQKNVFWNVTWFVSWLHINIKARCRLISPFVRMQPCKHSHKRPAAQTNFFLPWEKRVIISNLTQYLYLCRHIWTKLFRIWSKSSKQRPHWMAFLLWLCLTVFWIVKWAVGVGMFQPQ